MTVFRTPPLSDHELRTIARIDNCRSALESRFGGGRVLRWVGGLRRMSLARNVQASNSIEGYNASLDDVMMAMDGEPPLDADADTAHALAGYRDALTYVLQIADDRSIQIDTGLLRSLHFMMLKHDLAKWPGRFRHGQVYVHESHTGDVVYEGPDADAIPALLDAMLGMLAADDAPPLVRAAMAHLNLVMIHPFRDGNGRMARCLQTFVLAREDIAHPVFSSIEEYLGANTPAYYRVLADVGGGSWHPDNDADEWVRFCLDAHLHQAEAVLRRFDEAERLWEECDRLARRYALPERTVAGLWEAARGLRVRRPSYIRAVGEISGETISPLTASRDLKAMVHSSLLVPRGETRGRHYVASDELLATWRRIRGRATDPGARR